MTYGGSQAPGGRSQRTWRAVLGAPGFSMRMGGGRGKLGAGVIARAQAVRKVAGCNGERGGLSRDGLGRMTAGGRLSAAGAVGGRGMKDQRKKAGLSWPDGSAGWRACDKQPEQACLPAPGLGSQFG